MEYLDILDKVRMLTGRITVRGEPLKSGEFVAGAEVWIINEEHMLLLTQRSLLKSHPLMWECPGGYIISGESSLQAVIREAKEETGIELYDTALLSTQIYKNQFIDTYVSFIDSKKTRIILQPEETVGFKYVSVNELDTMYNENKIVKAVYERFQKIKHLI